MPTGYTFQGKGSTKARRLAVHKNAIHEQGGKMTGYNVALFVAQDQESGFAPQSDTRVQYDVYDRELAESTNNAKGVDNTIALSKGQVEKIKEVGDHGNDYYVFEADIMFTEKGAIPNTKTIAAVDQPFDKEKHDAVTKEAREAKRAQSKEVEKEAEVEPDLEP